MPPTAELGDPALQTLRRDFPVVGLVPYARAGLTAYALESPRGRRALLSPGGRRVNDLSRRATEALQALEGGRWKGASLAAEPDAVIRLYLVTAPDRAQLGYTVTAGGVEEKSFPTIRAKEAGLSPMLLPPETDAL